MDTSSCRVIFGEADFLPGLVVDKFSDVLVVESLAPGHRPLKARIVDKLLKELLAKDGVTSAASTSAATPRSAFRRDGTV